MDPIPVKILNTEYVTHDVKRFVVEKPIGYKFIPGQATEISINIPELLKEKRPFSFTGLNSWTTLEFMIKIHRERNGFTKRMERLHLGDELLIRQPFGVITYKGKGVFIAGGSGITPFVAILRQLYTDNQIEGNTLIFSNKTSDDIILEEEFDQMLGNNFYALLTRENVIGYTEAHIDEEYLAETVRNFNQNFYICGPEAFVKHVEDLLLNTFGVRADSIIIEK